MDELSFIARLRARLGADPRLLVPPGDDCALVHASEGDAYLYAADMLMDGVHFDLKSIAPRLAGRKALAVNLSDIAAMAGTPEAVTVSLAVPRSGGFTLADEMMAGLEELARQESVTIAGGDTNAWNGPAVIAVSITGRPHRRGVVTRGGAKSGDVIMVTGALGGSLASGRHLTFQPRLAAARRLHERHGLTAMIDLSDGLATDLRHILAASRIGARLEREAIPLHRDAKDVDCALTDGEDFELCFTAPPAVAAQILDGQDPDLKITKIGVATSESETLVWQDGTPITLRGYTHAF